MRTFAVVLALAETGCNDDSPDEPSAVNVHVPTNTTLRLYGRDIGMCCVDACDYPPVLEDILLDGTKLSKAVRDGLPAGVTPALEFTVTGSGAIRQ